MRPCDPISIISSPRAAINGIEQYSDIYSRSKELPMEECKFFCRRIHSTRDSDNGKTDIVYPFVFVELISSYLSYIDIHATSYFRLQNMGKINSVWTKNLEV
jgi:hypothetical protein